MAWVGDEGPDESSMVRLADNRIYCIFDRTPRHAGPDLVGRRRPDPGRRQTSTGFKGVAPKLRRLSNGVLACTYGRPGPVTIMFSLDGTGKTWSHLTPIFSGMSTRYTDFIEISPGHLLVVYDSVPYGWDPIPEADTTSLNRVQATLIDVEKTLRARSIIGAGHAAQSMGLHFPLPLSRSGSGGGIGRHTPFEGRAVRRAASSTPAS